MKQPRTQKTSKAFTLAELLIALAILGVIATFTIPKVLQAQQDEQYNTAAHEAASMIAGSFSIYKLQNAVTGSTKTSNFTSSFNYVKQDTSSLMDSAYDCSDTTNWVCLKLHTGGTLYYWKWDSFCNTTSSNGIPFWFDPDGGNIGNPAIVFYLYADGKIRTKNTVVPNTTYGPGAGNCTQTINPSGSDPSWFHWN